MGRDQHGGVEPLVEFAEEAEQALAHFLVDISGRFVGDDQVGLHDDGARDRDALFFAARQGRGPGLQPVAQADPFQQFDHVVPVAFLVPAQHAQGQGDILVGGQVVEQPEFLEDHPDPPPQGGKVLPGQPGGVDPEK